MGVLDCVASVGDMVPGLLGRSVVSKLQRLPLLLTPSPEDSKVSLSFSSFHNGLVAMHQRAISQEEQKDMQNCQLIGKSSMWNTLTTASIKSGGSAQAVRDIN